MNLSIIVTISSNNNVLLFGVFVLGEGGGGGREGEGEDSKDFDQRDNRPELTTQVLTLSQPHNRIYLTPTPAPTPTLIIMHRFELVHQAENGIGWGQLDNTPWTGGGGGGGVGAGRIVNEGASLSDYKGGGGHI
jgi:hypothetical protein